MRRADPHSVTAPDQGRVTRIRLDLDIDFASRRLVGEARLSLADVAGGALDLDTRALEILGVTDGAGHEVTWSLGSEDPVLGTPLRLWLDAGTAEIRVRYATSPNATALQWLEPSQTAGGQHPYLFSQCQSIHARSMVPLQDSPLVRFSYHARLTVPEPLSAVMSAAPGRAEPGPRAGTRTFSFDMPQPIPSYLLALAVGDLAAADLGPRSRVYTEPTMLEASAWEFADVDRMLSVAEELFGPYRWDRFDFLVMPPAFPYGGMENPRLTFLTPALVVGDRSRVNVLAHELAHSWTGNLVTNATLDDFWLNEGFTVWAERRILEALSGQEALSKSAAIGLAGLEEELERFGEGSPLTRLQTDLLGADPDEVYSRVPYEKGFLFVTLLEQTAGREAWDAFVRDYIDHFGFQSLSTAEFEAFLDERLPGLAARVGAEEWLRGPGLPDNAPRFRSAPLEALEALTARYAGGERPDAQAIDALDPDDWLIFLSGLPRPFDPAECAWLDATFDLNQARDPEILATWLELAIPSGYEPSLPRAGEFLGTVGRMKYLNPLFQALHQANAEYAAEVYADNEAAYHPIARMGLRRILKG